jgi:hypothetical protein
MLKFGSQHDMRKGERLIFNFEGGGFEEDQVAFVSRLVGRGYG